MQKLIRGVHQFQTNVFSSHWDLFQRLASGQRPEALFITCSDSRIDPNLVTQTRPGELFVLRNAGNIVPPYCLGSGESATIEMAVTALGVRDVIVCGHTHCAAMAGLLDPSKLDSMPAVRAWLENASETRRIIQEKYQDVTGLALLTDAAKENVLVQLDHLREYPAVAEKLAAGHAKLHGWIYHLETGEFFGFEPAQGKFIPLGEF